MAKSTTQMTPEGIMAQPVTTVEGLRIVLGCGRNQAYTMVRTGAVRSIRVGNSIRIPTSAIRELLDGVAA